MVYCMQRTVGKAEQAILSKEMAANAAALGKESADAGGIDIITGEMRF